MSPVPHKTNQYVEIERQAEDEWGNKLYNDDGTEQMETIEKNIVEMRFKKQFVFDLSQTNGKPIPDPVQELVGEIDEEKLDVIFKGIKKATGIAPEYRTITGGAKGYYSPSAKSIIIKTGMSGEQVLKTVVHESAHCLLHDPDKKIVTTKSPRNEKEVQAESIAFIVCKKLGVDTSDYSFPYIDANGMPGTGDMTPEVYDMLSEKTYAPENKEEFERFKAAYEHRIDTAGTANLPTEYYGVRQNNSGKYAVVGIAADGIVTVVKDSIASIPEAKTTLMEVYEKRKDEAHVELMHPQTIDEISARMYDPSQGLATNQYRIEKCDDKPDTTHMLVKYTLDNNDGNYNQTGVLCYGDYFDCNDALKAAIASPTQPMPSQDKPTFEIYQLKGGDDTRDMRFISLDRLAEQGKKPDISTYDKVYEGDYRRYEKSSPRTDYRFGV